MFFILVVVLTSCKSSKNIVGVRERIFSDTVKLSIGGDGEIEINKNINSYKNYYGDGSILNDKIENFKWRNFAFEKPLFSNPIFINGKLFYVDSKGRLNGKVRVLPSVVRAKISFYDNAIYATSGTDIIAAFEKDGTDKWTKKLSVVPISSPVVDGDNLYFITNDNKTYCLSASDGGIKWIHYGGNNTTKMLGVANPVIYNNYLITSYSSGDLFILNKHTGEIISAANLVSKNSLSSVFNLTDIDSTPTIKDGILVASANNGDTVGFDLKTMQVLWKISVATLSNIIVNGDFIYLISTDNALIAVNFRTGNVKWSVPLGENLYKTMIFANNKVIVFGEQGYKVIDPIAGKIEKRKEVGLVLYSNPIFIEGQGLYGVGK